MRLFAFQGSRYSSADGNPGRHAAPPYDQIGDGERDRLHAADPHQFARLSRPVAAGDLAPAPHAAALYADWRDDGIVGRDAAPALYPYEIRLADGGRRLGVFGLVGLEEPDSGIIRPHEETITKTVEERLELLRRLRVDLGPVLLLAEDDGALDALLAEDLGGNGAATGPLAEHRDAFGHLHRLFRIDHAGRLERYRSALAAAPGLIADGHHRYKTARLYAAETGAATGAAAAKLCVVTSLASPALTIEPIHRALDGGLDPSRPERGVLERRPWRGSGGRELVAEVAAAEQPALGLLSGSRRGEIWRLDPAAGPAHLPAGASQLSVVLLHHALLPQWGLPAAAATDGTVRYRSDPEELASMVERGEAGIGIFLPPMSTDGFAAAIADGDVLPPKSTRFMPKVVSGLVWSEHTAAID